MLCTTNSGLVVGLAARFSLPSGKAPYHPICIGPAGDRYADRSLQGGTAKIDRRRLISTVSGRLKTKRLRRRGKKKKEEEKKYLAPSSPVRRPALGPR
ncbi:hypothetical protein B296_00014670 [Ensete ventricosum]|uniref:Uncharacterized protein n=1 Tax=Ensete ventricosum TaxID=4639 RepID=A0A426ZNG5_ENSVE|nr:hypothetical protein B296_00014670 [Ensete ventricosum]